MDRAYGAVNWEGGVTEQNWLLLALAVLALGTIVSVTHAEVVTYQIDETQSMARVLEGVPPPVPGGPVLEGTQVATATAVVAQVPGSLETSLSGFLTADLTGSTLTFTGGSRIDANENPHGPFAPPASSVGSDSREDNFGGQDHLTGSLLKVAVRDAVVDITSGSATLGGPVTGLHFGFNAGTLEYAAPFLGTGFMELAETIPPGPDRDPGPMTGSVDEAITIPFLMDESYQLFQLGNSRLVLEGVIVADRTPALQAGDADQDLDFDQFDLIRVQQASKYLTGQPATWGEGDWNGAPGGYPGHPPVGDGQFSQLDIISALDAGFYLTGPYRGRQAGGVADGQRVPIPEPSGIVLLVLGLLSLIGPRHDRRT